MEEQTWKSVEVAVAGRSYPVKVSPEEESSIRNIERNIDQKIKHFQRNYSNLDKTDCVSMALLTYAFDLHKAKHTGDSSLSDKLAHLESVLDEALT